MSKTTLVHKFVEFIPDELKDGNIYVSIPYATCAHKCFCGCGSKVVTPLGPTDWKLIFDGDSVSLYPSIGNWNLQCRSHYWIRNNKIVWAPKWTQKEIDAGRAYERSTKERHYE